MCSKRAGLPMLALKTVSCIETSTTWGRPVHSAVIAASAASGPVWPYPEGSVQRTGARSGSPVQNMLALAAITPRSEARQPACGPDDPKGVTRTHTACAARAGSSTSAPGKPGVSITTSAPASSSASAGVVGARDGHAALAGGPRGEAVGQRTQRVALGWLDEHDVGAQVGEEAPGHRGRLTGQVDDAHAVEQGRGHVHPPAARSTSASPGSGPPLSLTPASAYSEAATPTPGGANV